MISHGKEIAVFAGNSNTALAEDICAQLYKHLGSATGYENVPTAILERPEDKQFPTLNQLNLVKKQINILHWLAWIYVTICLENVVEVRNIHR